MAMVFMLVLLGIVWVLITCTSCCNLHMVLSFVLLVLLLVTIPIVHRTAMLQGEDNVWKGVITYELRDQPDGERHWVRVYHPDKQSK